MGHLSAGIVLGMVFKNHLFVIMLIRLKKFILIAGGNLPNVPFVRQSDNGSPVLTNITTANGNLFLVLLHRVSQVSGFCFLPFFFNRKCFYFVSRKQFAVFPVRSSD